MNLTKVDTTRARLLYHELNQERKWSYPISMFRFAYLDNEENKTLARFGFASKTIWLHPEAFNWPSDELLKGLINHEMSHWLLGAEEGHGKGFHSLEQEWRGYDDYRIEVVAFANHLRAREAEYELTCLNCGEVFQRKEKPNRASACRICCTNLNKGEWSPRYKLHIGVVPSLKPLGPGEVRVDG